MNAGVDLLALLTPLRVIQELGEKIGADLEYAQRRLQLAGQMVETMIALLENVKRVTDVRIIEAPGAGIDMKGEQT